MKTALTSQYVVSVVMPKKLRRALAVLAVVLALGGACAAVVWAADITVDGLTGDWSGVSTSGTDNDEDVLDGYDIEDYYFTESDNHATFYMRFDVYSDTLAIERGAQVVTYFDIDQDPTTGQPQDSFFGNFGADAYASYYKSLGGANYREVGIWNGVDWDIMGTPATLQTAYAGNTFELGVAYAALGIDSTDCFSVGIHFENYSDSPDDNVLGEHCDTPTGVSLSSFTVNLDDGSIVVEWQTADELDVTGFNVWRSTDTADHGMQLNSAIIPAQTPGELTGNLYTYVDDTALPNSHYYYWLEVKQVNAISAWYGPVEPIRFRLYLPVLLRGE